MATNKEEVLFKVKAELSGFKKSMDELKKMAKETSNNVKKSMNMDLSKEGSNAGKTFAKGFNEEMKSATDSVKLELKKLAEQASNIKIKVDITGLEYVKRQLADITVNVSTDSDRASASMSNNANAPNGFNSMSSIANSGALTRLTAVMNSIGGLIRPSADKMRSAGELINASGDKIKDAATVIKDAAQTIVRGIKNSSEKINNKVKDTKNRVNTESEKIKSDPEIEKNLQKIEKLESLISRINIKMSNMDPMSDQFAKYASHIARATALLDDFKEKQKKLEGSSIKLDFKDLQLLSRNAKDVNKLTEAFKKLSSGIISSIGKVAKSDLNSVGDIIVRIGNRFSEFGVKALLPIRSIRALGSAFSATINAIDRGMAALDVYSTRIINSTGGKIKSLLSLLPRNLNDVKNLISSVTSRIGKDIHTMNLFLDIAVENTVAKIKGMLNTLKSGISSSVSAIGSGVSNIISRIGQDIHTFNMFMDLSVENIESKVKSIASTLKTGISSALSGIGSGISNVITRIGQDIHTFNMFMDIGVDNLINRIKNIPSAVSGIFDRIGQDIHTFNMFMDLAVENAENKIKLFATSLKSSISSALSNMGSAISNVFDRIGQDVHTFNMFMDIGVDNIINKIKGIPSSISGIFDRIEQDVHTFNMFMDIGVDNIIKRIKGIPSSISGIFNRIEQDVHTFNMFMDMGLNNIEDKSKKVINSIKNVATKVSESGLKALLSFSDTLSFLHDNTNSKFKSMMGLLKNESVKAAETCKKAFYSFSDMLSNYPDNLNNAFKNMTIVKTLDSVKTKVSGVAKSIWSSLKSVPSTLNNSVKEAGNTISSLGTEIKDFGNNIGTSFNNISTSIRSFSLSNVKNEIKTSANNMISEVKTGITNSLSEIKISTNNTVAGIKNKFSEVKASINDSFSGFKDGLKTGIKQQINHLNDYKAKLTEIKSNTKDAFSNFGNNVKSGIQEQVRSLSEYKTKLSEVKVSIKEAFSNFGGKSKTGVQEQVKSLSEYKTKLKDIKESSNDAFSNFGGKSKVAIRELIRSLDEYKSKLIEIKSNIKDAFGNKVEKECDTAINAFSRLKNSIKSIPNHIQAMPIYFEYAKNTINNAIKGMDNSISSFGSKVKNFSNNIEGSMGRAAASIRNGFNAFRRGPGEEQLNAARSAVKRFTDAVNNNFPGIRRHIENVRNSFSNMGNNIRRSLNPINLISSAAKKAADGIRRIGNESSAASGKVDKLKGSFTGLLGKLGMFFSVYQLFGLMKQGTEDAIKYEAQILNIQRTFGEASKSLTDFANKNAVSWGLSKQQVAEYGNIFGVIVKNINVGMAEAGASSDAIAKSTMNTTQELLKSAGMISSALGYDVETVLEGLRSGILGSSEAVDQFGLNLKQANLEASQAFMEVSNNGQIAWNNLTEAQRQYVITQEIINQTTRNFGQVLGQNGKIMQTTASLQAQYMAQLANTKLALGNLGKVLWTAILPPLTKILQVLEVVFNYAAAAMTALLGLFGIQVDFSSPSSAGGALTGMQNSLSNMEDTATNVADNTKYALNSIGDSATDSANKTEKAINKTEKVGKKTEKAAKKTEEAVKKVKRALAGFDQINVLNIKEDDNKKDDTKINKPKKDKSKIDKPKIDNPIGGFNPDDFKPTPLNPSDFGVQMPDVTPQLKSNLGKFKGFVDKMKNLLSELTEPFKKAWDFLGDRWIAAWNRLKKEFKHFCDSLAKFLKSVWDNGGKEFVQHMAEIALAVGIAAMEIGGTILHALAQLWEHLDPETNGHTQAFIDALNDVAEKVRDFVLSLNGYLENLMNNGGQEVLNAFGDMLMDLGTTAVRVFGVIIDAIQGLLDHLFGVNEAGQLTNEITKSMLEAWENAFRSIGDAALAFADLMESALGNGLQDVINSMGDLAMQISATMGTIIDELAQSMAALFDHMDPAKNDISKGALEGFQYFVDSITGFVRMLGEAFGTFMDNGGQEFVNNMGDIVAILIDLASTIAGDIINSITAFMNSWAGQTLIAAAARALELISSVLKGFLEILKPLTPVISGVIAGILAFMGATKVIGVVTKVVSVFKSVGSVLGLAKSAATLLWGVLAANPIAAVVAAVVGLGVALVAAYNKFDGFREAVDKILDAFSGLGEALKSAFSNILKDVTNIFQDVIDIIVGIFTGDGERVGKAVRSLVENILQLLWDVTTGVLDIGINLITGLAKGIWEAIKQAPKLIGDALTGLADFIKDFFKGLFGIHSPSTVFAEYGGYLVEGLADGITKAFDAIGDAFNSMFKYVKDKVSKITDGIKSGFKAIKDFVIPLPKMAWDKLKETAGNIVNKIKEKVEKFKAKLPKPSVVWDSIKTTAGKAIDNVKRVVQGFKSKLPKPSVMWDSLKTGVSNALNKVKDFIDKFKWKLPKPKLPKFSVSGGEAPWGFMGKGSLPKVDVKWNKAGGIMTSATIFGMAGNTLLGGGEAGAEGIIPLDELWNQLSRQFQQQNAILSSIVASGSGNSNRPVNITLKINDIEMGKAVISSLKALSNHGGTIDLPI